MGKHTIYLLIASSQAPCGENHNFVTWAGFNELTRGVYFMKKRKGLGSEQFEKDILAQDSRYKELYPGHLWKPFQNSLG